MYQNSRADCRVMFDYIKTGSVGSNINPSILDMETDTMLVLDNLPHIDKWKTVEMQIGRRSGQFRIVID